MFLHNLKVAWRNLLKYKVSVSIGVCGLAVGLLCFVLCMYCARLLWGVDQAFPNHKQIAEVMLKSQERGYYYSGSPASTVRMLEDKFPGKTACFTAVTYDWQFNASFETDEGRQATYILNTIETDRNFRNVFSCRLITGNWEQIDRQKNAVVLSEKMARRIYGQENPLGRLLHPNEFTKRAYEMIPPQGELSGIDYVVMGVMEDLPVNASFSFLNPVDALMFNDEYGLLANQKPGDGSGCVTYALLWDGVSCADLNQDVDAKKHGILLWDELYVPDFLPAGKDIRESYHFLIGFFGGIGCLILLVALLNFFTFLLGNYFSRLKEYQIRKGLGGNSKQLFGLLYTEILLYFIPVIILVFCLLELTYSRLDFGWGRRAIIFDVGLLYRQLLEYWIWGILICGLLCWGISHEINRKYVRGKLRSSSKSSGQWERNMMLGVQLIGCCLFLTGSLAMYKQLGQISNSFFPGLSRIEKENILEVNFNEPQLKGKEVFLIGCLSDIPGVTEVLQTDFPLLSAYGRGAAMKEGVYLEYRIVRVGDNFMSFLQMPLLEGQVFRHIGQGMADPEIAAWVGDDLLERHLQNYDEEGVDICGVTQGIVNVYAEGAAYIVWTMSEHPACCYLKVYPGTRKIVESKARALLQEWLPESVAPPIQTLQQVIEEKTEFYNRIRSILSFLAFVCVILTILGVYSAITIDTERRRKEMAIRKINGVSAWCMARLFVQLYIKLLSIAICITFPCLWWGLQTWLEEFTLRSDYGIGFWLMVLGILLVVIGITVVWKILEIVRVNPVKVLRDE